MAGNENRGGIGELIQLIKESQVPILRMCNDRNHQKVRSFMNQGLKLPPGVLMLTMLLID